MIKKDIKKVSFWVSVVYINRILYNILKFFAYHSSVEEKATEKRIAKSKRAIYEQTNIPIKNVFIY